MTSEQRYLFDLNGYLHLKNVLSEDELHLAREAACRYINTPPEDLPKGFEVDGNRYVNGFAFDKALECLVFHPKTWPIILEFTDRRPRLSGGTLQVSMADNDHHAFRLHCAREDTGPESSHYEARNDRIFCDNFAAFHYLTDVHPGDGGLVVIPGSHKSEFDRPLNFFNNGTMEGLDQPPEGVLPVSPKAGDVVIMTESLVHGATAWKPADRHRVVLLLRYATQESKSSLVSPEIKDRLSPETLELTATLPATNQKQISQMNEVSLSQSNLS